MACPGDVCESASKIEFLLAGFTCILWQSNVNNIGNGDYLYDSLLFIEPYSSKKYLLRPQPVSLRNASSASGTTGLPTGPI